MQKTMKIKDIEKRDRVHDLLIRVAAHKKTIEYLSQQVYELHIEVCSLLKKELKVKDGYIATYDYETQKFTIKKNES